MKKDSREKELFYQWSNKEDVKYSFDKIDVQKESYFIKSEPREYIREYHFETLPELKEELTKMWTGEKDMESIMQAVLVAAFKNKPMNSSDSGMVSSGQNTPNNGEKMPAYIYNF